MPDPAPTLSRIPILFGERTVRVVLPVRAPRFVRALVAVAHALESGNRGAAEEAVARIAAVPAAEGAVEGVGSTVVSPTLRAQTLARVLLDLVDSGWRVCVEASQILLVAPVWRAGGEGMKPDDVRAEKERVRSSLAARVCEQLERPATRAFILDQERAHFTSEGPRSILNLIADGSRLASALRTHGAEAIQPYLQPADSTVGRDLFTNLRLTDVFRYFRYYWSFPFGSTPGRSIPMLVRDAGQPNHPVCGLLALSSPVPRLGARDSALGWTPAWLEAVVAALDMPADRPAQHLDALDRELLRPAQPPVEAAAIFADVAALLGVATCSTAAELSAAIERLGSSEALNRLKLARGRLCSDLVHEVEDAIKAISFAGLGVGSEEALQDPTRALRLLGGRAAQARTRWLASREIALRSGPIAERPTEESLRDPGALRRLAGSPLFEKKRAEQTGHLLSVWSEISSLRGQGRWTRLRRAVLAVDEPWASGMRLTGGERVARSLRAALLQRQGRFLASQVADVSVCGALPPYGPILGGKLAALLALSRVPAQLYHDRYSGQASEIGSQMAGKPIFRPADLVALTTTSFYGVGSSQYERLRLPNGPRWRFVGFSAGHGTLQFSAETSAMMQALVRAETGRGLITSTFGEGPSERLRKVRDGLARLGLDVGELLQHGMPRRAFVADLGGASTRPGVRAPRRPWRLSAPEVEVVASYWRDRWLRPRLARLPELLEQVAAFSREGALLSGRLRASPEPPVVLGGLE